MPGLTKIAAAKSRQERLQDRGPKLRCNPDGPPSDTLLRLKLQRSLTHQPRLTACLPCHRTGGWAKGYTYCITVLARPPLALALSVDCP
jgi:hypothetical protein